VWFFKNAIVTLGNEELGGILAKGLLGKLLTTRAPLPGIMLFIGDAVSCTRAISISHAQPHALTQAFVIRLMRCSQVVGWQLGSTCNFLEAVLGVRFHYARGPQSLHQTSKQIASH